MLRIRLLAASLLVIAVGCGPMSSGPLPVRLEEKEQKVVDEAWDRAFAPMQQIDRQALLDFLVAGWMYQLGVDQLDLRSEKTAAAGKVVMIVHYERAHPEADRFQFELHDAADKIVRSETFDRNDVDTVQKDLGPTLVDLRQKHANAQATPEEEQHLVLLETREKAVQELLKFKAQDVEAGEAKPE